MHDAIYAGAGYAMDLCLSVCLSRALLYRNGRRIKLVSLHSGYSLHVRHFGISGLSKIIPAGHSIKTVDFDKFCHSTSIVASVVNLVRPTIVAS